MEKYDREFFKGLNPGKSWKKMNQKRSTRTNSQSNPRNNIVAKPFSEFSTTMTPSVPIQVYKNGKYSEWQFNGKRVRPYFAGNIWVSEDGQHVFWCWLDHSASTITTIKPVEIRQDSVGRYVKIKTKGKEILTYMDEALKTCFPDRQPQAPMHPPIISNQANPHKPTVTLVPHKGFEYAIYFEPMNKGEYPFWVSKTGGQAAFIRYDWHTHEQGDFLPYKINVGTDGRRSVSIKQKNQIYKTYDLAEVICTVFNGKPCCPGLTVRFIDGDINNYDADNLIWG